MFVYRAGIMVNSLLSNFISSLNKPVEGITLYLFRILFGIIAAGQLYIFWNIVPKYEPLPFHITYDFFQWIKPLNIQQANIAYPVFIVFALLFAAGILFRLSAFIVFIGLSYSFLVDKTIYNNHYYLFILISFLLFFSSAGKGITLLHPKRCPNIKMEELFILRWQICIVYLFGAINKINPDWLIHAQPVYAWLPQMLGDWVNDLDTKQRFIISIIICYAGLILDGIAGVLLMIETKWKYWFIPILLAFHLFNDSLFNIGLFPWFNIGATILFIAPSMFRRLMDKLHLNTAQPTTVLATNKLFTFAVTAWCAFQFLFPLRHWLIPGFYMWDERGMLFSWTMKLRDKEPIMSISVKSGNETYYLQPGKFVNKRQLKYLAYRPIDMAKFAKFVANYYTPELKARPQVYAEVFVSLNNYRPYQLIINPYVDLAAVELKSSLYTGKYNWIVPLGEDHFGLQPPKEVLEQSKK